MQMFCIPKFLWTLQKIKIPAVLSLYQHLFKDISFMLNNFKVYFGYKVSAFPRILQILIELWIHLLKELEVHE